MLRERLAEITLDLDDSSHGARISALAAEMPHHIVPVDSEHPLDRYTCVVHAFDLVEDPDYVHIAQACLGTTYAGPEFIEYLLERGRLDERGAGQYVAGDLVMYFRDGVFKHVGRVQAPDRVLSKWGTGLLLEHGTWEVPETYGSHVRYFAGPDSQACYDLFIDYAESRGWNFGVPES